MIPTEILEAIHHERDRWVQATRAKAELYRLAGDERLAQVLDSLATNLEQGDIEWPSDSARS